MANSAMRHSSPPRSDTASGPALDPCAWYRFGTTRRTSSSCKSTTRAAAVACHSSTTSAHAASYAALPVRCLRDSSTHTLARDGRRLTRRAHCTPLSIRCCSHRHHPTSCVHSLREPQGMGAQRALRALPPAAELERRQGARAEQGAKVCRQPSIDGGSEDGTGRRF